MGRILRAIAALVVTLVGAASWAEAQAADFPRRPVVQFAPGGGTPAPFTKLWMDTWRQLGRVIQQRHIAIG